jgi:antitoxin FitA
MTIPTAMLSLIAMAQLIVRDIPQEVVGRLKRCAASHGRSAEAEHREILKQVLLQPDAPSLKSLFSAMPNVGRDSDFLRPRRLGRRVKL